VEHDPARDLDRDLAQVRRYRVRRRELPGDVPVVVDTEQPFADADPLHEVDRRTGTAESGHQRNVCDRYDHRRRGVCGGGRPKGLHRSRRRRRYRRCGHHDNSLDLDDPRLLDQNRLWHVQRPLDDPGLFDHDRVFDGCLDQLRSACQTARQNT
jgi:hypothetical protein